MAFHFKFGGFLNTDDVSLSFRNEIGVFLRLALTNIVLDNGSLSSCDLSFDGSYSADSVTGISPYPSQVVALSAIPVVFYDFLTVSLIVKDYTPRLYLDCDVPNIYAVNLDNTLLESCVNYFLPDVANGFEFSFSDGFTASLDTSSKISSYYDSSLKDDSSLLANTISDLSTLVQTGNTDANAMGLILNRLVSVSDSIGKYPVITSL